MRRSCTAIIIATLVVGVSCAAFGTPNEPVTWSVVLNPYANSSTSPYLVNVSGTGTTVFNPFAVPEVRRAINRYIDRASIRDNILPAGSAIAYSPVRIGVPTSAPSITMPNGDTYSVYLNHEHSFDLGRMYPGISLWGDKPKLLAEVKTALTGIQTSLPLLQLGSAGIWQYDGKDVEVSVLRPTNSKVLYGIASHMGGLLKDCGFTVAYTDAAKDVLRDMALCCESAKHSEFAWSVYVEAWVTTDEAVESIPHILAAQAYSAAFSAAHLSDPQLSGPCQGFCLGMMPSSFKTPLIDNIYEFMMYRFEGMGTGGKLLSLLSLLPATDDAYWHLLSVEVWLGMENAVRIFLGFQDN